MREVASAVSRVYLIGAIWLSVMLGAAAVLVVVMESVYSAAELDAMARTMSTMALATLAATGVAGLVWKRTRRVRPTASARLASGVFAPSPAHEGSEGQGLAEYALILGLIAVVAIVSLTFLGGSISDLMSMIGATVDSVT